ncbi:hypothetical protein KZZ07_15030 [Mameliella sp. CS4]|uniref:DUF6653 family protein n=1 Tax=Mameliella sp. CS4 TaxID=2862329 RepID=UPI001C60749A|nr:DUF6653 family protein [Mameliella sp. CS4]MBW4983857.1 hypothetical protein [Mameliella sp. CS4]
MGAFDRSERLLAMTDDTWARHANPWSGWSRLSVLPLLSLAAFSRLWLGWYWLLLLALVLLWTFLNPRLFPEPAKRDNWMSRGVLGEKTWIENRTDPRLAHHAPVVKTLTGLTAAGTLVLLVGLVALNLSLTLTGLAVTMLGKLWLLDRMTWVQRDMAP